MQQGAKKWAAAVLVMVALLAGGCQLTTRPEHLEGQVILPFLKNSANECYFLDEFMPAPSNLVGGRSGSVYLRYYTYDNAVYKDWQNRRIILSFYSVDQRCWSLFEEHYAVAVH